jgi:hypothetical protein
MHAACRPLSVGLPADLVDWLVLVASERRVSIDSLVANAVVSTYTPQNKETSVSESNPQPFTLSLQETADETTPFLTVDDLHAVYQRVRAENEAFAKKESVPDENFGELNLNLTDINSEMARENGDLWEAVSHDPSIATSEQKAEMERLKLRLASTDSEVAARISSEWYFAEACLEEKEALPNDLENEEYQAGEILDLVEDGELEEALKWANNLEHWDDFAIVIQAMKVQNALLDDEDWFGGEVIPEDGTNDYTLKVKPIGPHWWQWTVECEPNRRNDKAPQARKGIARSFSDAKACAVGAYLDMDYPQLRQILQDPTLTKAWEEAKARIHAQNEAAALAQLREEAERARQIQEWADGAQLEIEQPLGPTLQEEARKHYAFGKETDPLKQKALRAFVRDYLTNFQVCRRQLCNHPLKREILELLKERVDALIRPALEAWKRTYWKPKQVA